MKFEVNKSKCAGCGACLRACPYGAIKIEEDGKAFIDQNKCKKCGTCQEICPFDVIERINKEEESKTEPLLQPTHQRPSPYSLPPFGGKGIMGREIGRGPQDGRGGGRGR